MGKHEKRVVSILQTTTQHEVATQKGHHHEFRVDMFVEVGQDMPMLGELTEALAGRHWWVEHFSRSPDREVILDVRAKFAVIETKTAAETRKDFVFIVLSDGQPRRLLELWPGLSQLAPHMKGVFYMPSTIPVYWVDTQRVAPHTFPLATLCVREPDRHWDRLAEAMEHANTIDDETYETLWEVVTRPMENDVQEERFGRTLRRRTAEALAEGKEEGRAEGKEEGRAEGKEEGAALGRRESLVTLLNLRFPDAFPWTALAKDLPSDSLLPTLEQVLSAPSAEEAKKIMVAESQVPAS